MPRHQSTTAAKRIVEDATAEPTVDLVAELPEPLAEYMLLDYEREDWQDSPRSSLRIVAFGSREMWIRRPWR